MAPRIQCPLLPSLPAAHLHSSSIHKKPKTLHALPSLRFNLHTRPDLFRSMARQLPSPRMGLDRRIQDSRILEHNKPDTAKPLRHRINPDFLAVRQSSSVDTDRRDCTFLLPQRHEEASKEPAQVQVIWWLRSVHRRPLTCSKHSIG